MEYNILTSVSSFDLCVKVRIDIERGWQPLGSVAIGNGLFAQAMTRQQLPWNHTTMTTTGDSGAAEVSLLEINERTLAL